MTAAAPHHVPVLLGTEESSPLFSLVQPKPGDHMLDVTLGLGGHAAAFLKAAGKGARLTGLDADAGNLETARRNLQAFEGSIELLHKNFREVASLQPRTFDIILADLGVSSPHFDDPGRGFSFRDRGPLDMRYDQTQGLPASQVLAKAPVEELTRIFSQYGELERSKTLAREIHEIFSADPLRAWTTDDLRGCVEKVFTYKTASVLPQVFQAIRIAVNDELGALEAFLASAPGLLKPGGRLGIISYHSLEDRLVKQTFRAITTPEINDLTGQTTTEAPYRLLTKKPLVPSEEETKQNPRARSAKMRAIQKR